MFLRRKRIDEVRTKIQIVESERAGGKVRQRALRHVGTARGAAEIEALEGVGRLIMEELRAGAQPMFSVRELGELTDLARRAAENPGPPGSISPSAGTRGGSRPASARPSAPSAAASASPACAGGRRKSANRIIKELVLARIARPLSKRATARELDAHAALPLNPDSVYRAMDNLDEAKTEWIRGTSMKAAETLLPEPLTAVFYDTTTLYFESGDEDDLRAKGCGKDGKPHRIQVLSALLITPEGLPVGCGLFPGNTCEGHTLTGALEALEARHPGLSFTLVADAGMISRENEEALRSRGTPYILGARLKMRKADEKEKSLISTAASPGGAGNCADPSA